MSRTPLVTSSDRAAARWIAGQSKTASAGHDISKCLLAATNGPSRTAKSCRRLRSLLVALCDAAATGRDLVNAGTISPSHDLGLLATAAEERGITTAHALAIVPRSNASHAVLLAHVAALLRAIGLRLDA